MWRGLHTLALFALLAGHPLSAAEMPDRIILFAVVNDVRKGDVTLLEPADAQSDVWVQSQSFAQLGIALDTPQQRTIGPETYVLLPRSEQIQVTLDFDRLELRIHAAPELLAQQSVSLARRARIAESEYASTLHGFINYDVGLRHVTDEQNTFSLRADPTLAWRGWSLRSQHVFEHDARTTTSERLATTATYDWPESMVRVAVGDGIPQAGVFGRMPAAAGIHVARTFGLNPGFSTVPTFAHSGTVATPSTAEVFVDGSRMASVNLQPGRYAFSDLYYFAGLHDVEIRLTDALGRQQQVALPFYFSAQHLRAGLHEFSYSAGALRGTGRDAGYRDLGFSGLHRYGYSDALTLSGYVERFSDYLAYGAGLTGLLPRAGIVAVDVAHSVAGDPQRAGSAVLATYSYSGLRYSLGASALAQTRAFGAYSNTAAQRIASSVIQQRQSVNVGWLIDGKNGITVDANRTRALDASVAYGSGLRYRRGLERGSQFGIGVNAIHSNGATEYSVAADVTLNFDRHWSLAARSARGTSAREDDIAIAYNGGADDQPSARLALKHSEDTRSVDLIAQQGTAYGMAYGAVRRYEAVDTTPVTAEELRFAGSFATLDNRVYAGRQVNDSFSVVEIDGVQGVRVYQNNQPMGATDANGRLYMPRLAAYAPNQVRVDDRDVPLQRQLTRVERSVVPRAGMGSVVTFSAPRLAAVSLVLNVAEPGDMRPLASVAVTVENAGSTRTSFTGPDGDLYLEGVQPGALRISATEFGKACHAQADIPVTDAAITELGAVECRHE